MSDKFKDVPLEADTRLLVNGLRSVGAYEALFQQWYWDGFFGKSFIFAEGDVEGLTDTELGAIVMATDESIEEEDITITRRRNGYAFVNFGFEKDDD
jgi:hypothetical protein